MTDPNIAAPPVAPAAPFDQIVTPAVPVIPVAPVDSALTPVEEIGNIIGSVKIRRVIYGIFGVAAISVGGVEAYYLGIHEAIPQVVTGATAVIAYLGIPTIGVALANTKN